MSESEAINWRTPNLSTICYSNFLTRSWSRSIFCVHSHSFLTTSSDITQQVFAEILVTREPFDHFRYKHTHRTTSLIFLRCFFHQQVGNVYWPDNFTSFQVPSRENGRDIVGSVKMSTMKMRATYAMACIPLVVFRFQTDRSFPFSFYFIVPWGAVKFESPVHPFF